MELIRLKSVGGVIDMNTGIIYPELANGRTDAISQENIDINAGVHVEECSDEWFDKLTDDDHGIINRFFILQDELI